MKEPLGFNPVAEVIQRIESSFPTIHVETETVPGGGEVFLLVDDPEVYYSDAYQEFIANMKLDFLWPRDLFGLYFALSGREGRISGVTLECPGRRPYPSLVTRYDSESPQIGYGFSIEPMSLSIAA